MRIFVAGGSGAIGRRLISLLAAAGHCVFGTTRSPEKARMISAIGGTPVIVDALDESAIVKEVVIARPEIIVHQLTAIPHNLSLRRFDRDFAATNELRTKGTMYLLKAAKAVDAHRFIAQSFGGWTYERAGEWLKTEEDPLDPRPPRALRPTLDSLKFLEDAVSSERRQVGIVLRYGAFYGTDNSIAADGAFIRSLQKRLVPIIGPGTGVWSFVHIDDAASATLAAVLRAAPGIYNIADSDPAPVSEWLPYLATCAGAQPPLHVSRWLGRALGGDQAVSLMNEIRGISNAKARQTLAWSPRWHSWRDGFAAEFH